MKILSAEDVYQSLQKLNPRRPYSAMYSSLYGGVVTDPVLMCVPVDDHIVHRGDGVFEAIRFTPSKIYLLKPHLERLFRSAEKIGLNIPMRTEELESVCCELRNLVDLKEGILRLFVSRGPGDFSPNPYTTIGSQLYVIVTEFKSPSPEMYKNGASLMISSVGVKPSPFSQVKSCNYLPNVLMKKESVDCGYDFSLSVNGEGFVAEGPTENLLIVSRDGDLLAPHFDYTLRGTTLVRVMELAKALHGKGLIRSVELANISLEDLLQAREIMMVGTTLAVLSITKLARDTSHDVVWSSEVGAVARALYDQIIQDMN